MKRIFGILFALVLAVSLMLVPAASVGASPGPGLVGLWHLDEGTGKTAYDSTTNNNDGTLSGGRFDNALSFDGTDDYVNVPNPSSLHITDKLTVEAWIKPTGIPDKWYGDVVRLGFGYQLCLRGDGKLEIALYRSGTWGGWWNSVSAIPIPTTNFYHVAFTYDKDGGANNLKIYINGTLDAQYTAGPGALQSSGDLWISPNFWPFEGIIDEVRISDVARTITPSDLTSPPSVDGNTVALWRLDESVGSTAEDETANGNDGTIHGASWVPAGPTWTAGMFGNALSFDGTDDYVQVADDSSLDITDELTVEAWVKLDSITPKLSYVVAKDNYDERSYGLFVDGRTSKDYEGVPGFIVFKEGGVNSTVRGDTVLNTGQWYHLAGTYDYVADGTSVMKIYVDGSLDSTTVTNAVGPIKSGSANLQIGARERSGQRQFVDGLIDEVRIWDVALTPRALKQAAIEALDGIVYESERIDKAIEEINESLAAELWDDETHLVPKDGKKVFDHERRAVKELLHLLKCGGIAKIVLEYTGTGVTINVYLKDLLLGTFTVSTGGTFEVEATEATGGKLHPEIRLVIDDTEVAAFHTSCSRPIAIGDQDGDFVIVDLDKLPPKHEPGITDEVLAAAAAAIEDLVEADRMLAQTFLDDNTGLTATDSDRQDKVDKELNKAQAEMDKGDDAKKPDKAIHHYKKAWEHVNHAVKEAAKPAKP